jgi:hypothetical protein
MVDGAKPSARDEHKWPLFASCKIDGEKIASERHIEPACGFDEDYLVTHCTFSDCARYRLDIDCAPFERSGEKRRRRELEYLRSRQPIVVFWETNAAAYCAMNGNVFGKTVVASLDELDGYDIATGSGERTRHKPSRHCLADSGIDAGHEEYLAVH